MIMSVNKGLLKEMLPYLLVGMTTLITVFYFGTVSSPSKNNNAFIFIINAYAYFVPVILALYKAKSWVARILLGLFFYSMISLVYYYILSTSPDETKGTLTALLVFSLTFIPPYITLLIIVGLNFLKSKS